MVYIGIIVNSLLLALISDGFYYAISAFTNSNLISNTSFSLVQWIFVLLYENLLFVCAIVIELFVDDVPLQVRLGRESEEYILNKRNKNK